MSRILVTLFATFLFLLHVNAQPGTPDASFGLNGIVKVNFGDSTSYSTRLVKGLVSPDGSIFAVLSIGENISVLKLNADGTPDSAYGINGYSVQIPKIIGNNARLKNGKIVISGSYFGNNSNDIVLARLKFDGTFDSSFRNTGRDVISLGDYSDAPAIAIQDDDKIIVGGYLIQSDQIYIFRLNDNGSTDNSFSPYYGPPGSFPTGLNILNDGKILFSGANYNTEIVVGKLNNEGSPDNSFGVNGLQTTPVPLSNYLNPAGQTMVIDYSGNIVIGNAYGVFRYTADGSLDNSFNGDGILQTNFYVQGVLTSTVNGLFISGSLNNDLFIQKLMADGSTDNSFSGDGQETFDLGDDEIVRNLAFAENGNPVIFGGRTNVADFRSFEILQIQADGSFDPSFNKSGFLVSTYKANGPTGLISSIIQPDNKVVVAGYVGNGSNNDFFVARYLADGTIDDSFSSNGYSFIDFNNVSDTATSIASQADGKLLVTGSSGGNLAIVKLDADGALDPAFNLTGYKIYNLPVNVNATIKIMLQADGKILVISDRTLARFNPDGSEDLTFDSDGYTAISLSMAYDIALQADGKILVAGQYIFGSDDPEFGLTRYNADGAIDASFTGGTIHFPMYVGNTFVSDYATVVVVQQDGKILLAGNVGSAYRSPIYSWGIARINMDGSLDQTYNGTGKVYISPPANPSYLTDMVLQPDGKIILGGYGEKQELINDFMLARITADGKPDLSFGDQSFVKLPVSAGDNKINNLTLDDSKLYAAGLANFANTEGIIARFNLEGPIVVRTPAVTGFTLVNSKTDKDIQPLTDGSTIEFNALSAHLNIRANTNNQNVESVVFILDGRKVRIENGAPYALAGDKPSGNYHDMHLALGDHTLTAIPYTKNNAQGVVGTSLTIHFTITGQKVESFTLVNAAADSDIQPISDGAVLYLDQLPTHHLNIRANTNPRKVGSVVFSLDGKIVRTENGTPYALAGDFPSGDYHAWNLQAGSYTLEATPYSNYNAKGIMGESLTIHFTIIAGSPPFIANAVRGDMLDQNLQLKLYPNPAREILIITQDALPGRENSVQLSIVSVSGHVVKTIVKANQQRIQINISSLPAGAYFLKVAGGGKTMYKPFVKL